MGIAPPHFNQGTSTVVFPLVNRCSDVWWQYDWQGADSVSRESLARAIADAEFEMAEALGWWPAPRWMSEEVSKFARHYRPEVYGIGGSNVRTQRKSVKTRYGKVIAGGQRAVTELTGAILTLSDADGDGFDETARITVATTLTDPRKIKTYFADHDGDPLWEIRPARSKAIAGGFFTAYYWSWQFLDPDLWEALPLVPASSQSAIDLDVAGNYVDSAGIEVYYEYNDTTATMSTFYWEPEPRNVTALCSCGGTGTCEACALTTQNGCLQVRDAEAGIVVPVPASYDDDDAQWDMACFTDCRDPDQVKIWYYAGEIDERYMNSLAWDPLPQYWAEAIAWLATARLERDFCSCANVTALAADLRKDMAYVPPDGGAYAITPDLLSNPFGTRRGEVKAWQRVKKIAGDVNAGAAAI